MDLRYGEDYERFRRELRAFLASWPLQGEEAELPATEQEALFRRRAIERGYVYRSFPAEYGGGGRPHDVLIDAIVQEEFVAADVPGDAWWGPGPSMLAPTLLEVGTESQKQRFISPSLRGEIRWCQGYSEPQAGSDLASLSSRAELDGDEWVIHGHKIWTSSAHEADFLFGLFRTEPESPRHAGISYLLVDLRQAGVTIEPIRELTGARHFNEVRFEGARTPADCLVGRRGEGWRVAHVTLRHERAMLADAGALERLFRSLCALARRKRRSDDRSVRRRLAAIEGRLASHVWTVRRRLSAVARGREADVARPTLMLKYCGVTLREEMVGLALDLLGDQACLEPDATLYKGTPETDAEWIAASHRALAYSIGGGTGNIQLNVIGERGYGLPRDLRRG